MSCYPSDWSSWVQEEFSTPGAGPSWFASNDAEVLSEDSAGARVLSHGIDYTQPYNTRAPGSLIPAIPLQTAPVLGPPLSVTPIPIPAALPAWASTSTPAPLAPHHWATTKFPGHAMIRPRNPPPCIVQSFAATIAPTATTTELALAMPAAVATPAITSGYPAPDDISIARSIPPDAQWSNVSAWEGTVNRFTSPWMDMARSNLRWDAVAMLQAPRKRMLDAEEQQPLKRAKVGQGFEEMTRGVSESRGAPEGEEIVGKGNAKEVGGRVRSEGREKAWSWERRYRRIAPKPAPRLVEAAGGLRPMPVVVPQVYGNALHNNNQRSTTSTHWVNNPAGKPVIEPVPLWCGGPSASTPADDQGETREPDDHDHGHDERQYQLGDEPALSRVEAAVVIDEKIYGGDIFRCAPCNRTFCRKYDRRRHIVTVHYLGKLPCDWCHIFFYARRDGVTRHKKENCPAMDYEDRDTNPWGWFIAWLTGPHRGGTISRGLASAVFDLLRPGRMESTGVSESQFCVPVHLAKDDTWPEVMCLSNSGLAGSIWGSETSVQLSVNHDSMDSVMSLLSHMTLPTTTSVSVTVEELLSCGVKSSSISSCVPLLGDKSTLIFTRQMPTSLDFSELSFDDDFTVVPSIASVLSMVNLTHVKNLFLASRTDLSYSTVLSMFKIMRSVKLFSFHYWDLEVCFGALEDDNVVQSLETVRIVFNDPPMGFMGSPNVLKPLKKMVAYRAKLGRRLQ
ncbi:hypothetical protein HETIRDRAFT_121112 [Heterobasidion irregulare TC 32-1]|uniref:C2H2-type domain-containing protein n=1 Tax=Heterobasidion irregulare (strain TC 32-1) TaxID=747525 RepID=W4KHU5_HETIT|nr:uncharacterized protein HETIRDRAFT_121112 [Heterobasidion irregulare TC 32-1]ETW84880.1 hypothetical protein HETIRDRAFT_121112 [Heterobasidion irregulare TC 32-1]